MLPMHLRVSDKPYSTYWDQALDVDLSLYCEWKLPHIISPAWLFEYYRGEAQKFKGSCRESPE